MTLSVFTKWPVTFGVSPVIYLYLFLLHFLMNGKHRWITEQKQTSKFTCHGG